MLFGLAIVRLIDGVVADVNSRCEREQYVVLVFSYYLFPKWRQIQNKCQSISVLDEVQNGCRCDKTRKKLLYTQ